MKTTTVDKPSGQKELTRQPGESWGGNAARATAHLVDGHGQSGEKGARGFREPLKLVVCLFSLIAVIVASAIAYGHYTTACYAQLVCGVDREALADVIRTGYNSSRWQFTRLAVLAVFGIPCAFLFARHAL